MWRRCRRSSAQRRPRGRGWERGEAQLSAAPLRTPTAVRLRIERAKITLVPRAEPLLVIFCVVLQAGVHPVDADPRLLKLLLTAKLVEIGRNSLEFLRDALFSPYEDGSRPL